ncbi:DNA polymerase III subunit tau [Methylophaga muralis]|uniref:DNA polymerase III subunit gamma/tau n=2 Tax=Methylophaga muralis TaxID=291169 RepID=A0A1E3GSW5_9GAMM|nr:DNA polymerase III subunit tau [Methylophaga muralis]
MLVTTSGPEGSSAAIGLGRRDWAGLGHHPYDHIGYLTSYMSYLVLARKWRPKKFAEVVGQQHVLRALINGLDQNRLHHAFLFAGTRGVGKTTLARIFAKSLNCEQGISSTPCGVCNSCVEVDSGRFVDLIEVDAASRTKVDDTRELLDNVQYAPSRGRYKVYLIDEVHMLSTSSFNALLKTLEEPPPHVKFLFATTDPQKLPVTILSRCLQFNLRRLDIKQIADHLAFILQQENIEFEVEALNQIAFAADGSMRDALSLLDQAIAFAGGMVTAEIVSQMLGSVSQQQLIQLLEAFAAKDAKALLAHTDELASLGRDFVVVLDGLMTSLQRIATIQLIADAESLDQQDDAALQNFANIFSTETVQLLYQIALHGKRDMPYAADPRSGFEMTLLRMLSFQPQAVNANLGQPPVKKPQADSKSVPAMAPEHATVESIPTANSPETTINRATELVPQNTAKPQADIAPLEINEAPVEHPTDSIALNKPEKTAVELSGADSAEQLVSLTTANWTALIAQLKLSAFARQLADHCAFIRTDNQKIYLSVAPELQHLTNEKSVAKLQAAVSKQLNVEVILVFTEATDTENVPTLAAERAQQAAEVQQNAVDAIHNDPVVEQIKNAFNARIIDTTIKPL